MNTKKEFYTIPELVALKLKNLPTTIVGIRKKARREQWKFKNRMSSGGGLEYAFESLPCDVRAEIVLKQARVEQKSVEQNYANINNLLTQNVDLSSLSFKRAESTKKKVLATMALADLLISKIPFLEALELVANKHSVKSGALKNWYYKCRNFERSLWFSLLVGNTGKGAKTSLIAPIDDEIWDMFLCDYLRPEKPAITAVYRRVKRVAREKGIEVPHYQTFKRRLVKEIRAEVITYKRDGERALFDLYPAMTRTVEDLEAMEWINGDGYQHNVFVKWKNGEILRPKTWIWQDVRTRKIIGFRCDVSENTDSIRLSLMDVVKEYGIPRHITIDNTRAAANKWLTGGVPNRYRFKVKEDDPIGIIPMLGIQLHWTSVIAGTGHGQAKPIERAFSIGGLGEVVDKHPSLAGFYTGSNPKDTPDNYNKGKDGVDYEVFMTALQEGIKEYNTTEGRDTEICKKVLSFEQAFMRDYALATVRKAPDDVINQLMLMSEAVTLKANGEFTLDAGGSLYGRKNRYWSENLIGTHHKKVVVRFDPEKLHEQVDVFTLNGIYLAKADCVITAGFSDTVAAREHKKHRTAFVKSTKKQAKSLDLMNAIEMAQAIPEIKEETLPNPSIIELATKGFAVSGSNALKPQLDEFEDDELSEFDKAVNAGILKARKQG